VNSDSRGPCRVGASPAGDFYGEVGVVVFYSGEVELPEFATRAF